MMKRAVLGSLVVASFMIASGVVQAAAPQALQSTRGDAATSISTTYLGCCTDPDVRNYGHRLDFNAYSTGTEIAEQFRGQGVLFGAGATPLAARTYVRYDVSRGIGCKNVLNGDPVFPGWEFFVFVDPVQDRWATVQNVGIDIGYCDGVNTSFIAAYDGNGNLLESKFNDRVGFQYLWIERPSPDISVVLVGDCVGAGTTCYPDNAGTALNCVSFSTPVSNESSLPDTIRVPEAPIVVGFPAASPVGLVILALALIGTSVWAFRSGAKVSGGGIA